VRFLLPLTSGVKTGQDYREGNTTLHWAIYSEFWIGVSILLRSGVDFDLPNYAGESGRSLLERKLNSVPGKFFLLRNVRKDLEDAIRAKEQSKMNGNWMDWIMCRVTQIQVRSKVNTATHKMLKDMLNVKSRDFSFDNR